MSVLLKVAIVLGVLVCVSVGWLGWEIRNAKPDPRDP